MAEGEALSTDWLLLPTRAEKGTLCLFTEMEGMANELGSCQWKDRAAARAAVLTPRGG